MTPLRAGAVRPRTVRHVDHVMGMPISLALRGRHADDDQGRVAWSGTMASLMLPHAEG